MEGMQAFIKETKGDMRDDSIRKVMDLHVVYGQKSTATVERRSKAPKASNQHALMKVDLILGAGLLLAAAIASVLAMSWLRRR